MSTQVLPKPLAGFEHVYRNWDGHWQCPAAKILPGECYVSNQDEVIYTVLGSCISVCIRDRRLGVGGMNHFMLPVQEGRKESPGKIRLTQLCVTATGPWSFD